MKLKAEIRRAGSFKIFTMAVTAMVIFVLVQDYLETYFNKSAFYLSEALLFSTFWWLFAPLLYFQYRYIQQKRGLYHPKVIGMVILFPILLHILLFPVLVWLFSGLCYKHTFAFDQTLQYTIKEHTYHLIVGYTAAVLLYWFITPEDNKMPDQPLNDLAKNDKVVATIVINERGKQFLINTTDIQYIIANTPYINIHQEGKCHLHAETLRSITEKLAPNLFIRVHKSTIINLLHLHFYRSRLNGDYDLTMADGTKLRLSRNYVPLFRQKLKETPQLTAL